MYTTDFDFDLGEALHRLARAGINTSAIEATFAGLDRAHRGAAAFLYQTMPLSDAVNYPPSVILDYVCNGVANARGAFGARIPKDIFLHYVLCHRVNTEELSPCRSVFAQALATRAAGLTMIETALEVNRWCGEAASYHQADIRTASALTVYRSGYGRCGEESTFVTQALRSVGIPARQVYAPHWSHCDDNHAWVECWCDGVWHFLGACEPESALDRGWFVRASSRAMLAHARCFGETELPGGEQTQRMGLARAYNQIERYARVRRLTVTVLDEAGHPAAGARVQLDVLNYAAFRPIAVMTADARGQASITVGKGSLLLTAVQGERRGEALVDPEDTRAQMTLGVHLPEDEGFMFYAPAESDVNVAVGPADERARTAALAAAVRAKHDAKRADFAERARTEGATLGAFKQADALRRALSLAYGNEGELTAFLRKGPATADLRAALLLSLSDKDFCDARADVLNRHLEAALPYRDQYPEDVFVRHVACPRIWFEPLTDYRRDLKSLLPAREQDQMRLDPGRIRAYVERHVKGMPDEEYPGLVTLPAACLRSGAGSPLSRDILCVAIARTLGVAAYIDRVDGSVVYYRGQDPVPERGDAADGVLLLTAGAESAWSYERNWTLSRLADGRFQPLDLADASWADGALRLNLAAGRYRLLTAGRLPNGHQCARQSMIEVRPGRQSTARLSLYSVDLSEMLSCLPLPDFALRCADGAIALRDIAARSGGVLIWLKSAEEPSAHILNELYEHRAAFAPYAQQLHLILFDERDTADPLVARLREALPGIRLCHADNDADVHTLARRVYLEPGVYPLVICTGGKGEAVYSTCGYNVGTADMLARILAR
ncbi:MAG: transglutaminase domain-containing protein [Eubacteriales bacterium]|nr:transglutaminase domain-containing protein [Christensenellaceae bacterium]MEA5065375.1 transglutaminase domain-containing protein [Eubacteriales bacterium]